MGRKAILLIAVIILSLAGSQAVLALAVPSPAELNAIQCAMLKNKIQTKLETIDGKLQKNVSEIGTVGDNISFIIRDATPKGYNTELLKRDLDAYNAKAAVYFQDLATLRNNNFMQILNDVCSGDNDSVAKSKEKIKSDLGQASRQIRLVKFDLTVIKDYYQATVRPDIITLKSQKFVE